MDVGRSPEINVLLTACTEILSSDKQHRLGQYITERTFSWDKLHTLALRHRIAPFLYRTLQQIPDVPEAFLAKLQSDCRMIATDNMLKLHEYDRLTNVLADQGIQHIGLKGIYLAKNSYPNSNLRSIGDFDLLIARNDLLKTIRLLEENQYQLGEAYKHYLRYKEQTILADLHEVSLFKPFFATSYFNIDLHWEIECFNKHYSTLHLEDVLSEPEFITENQLLLTIIHHGVINIWQHIGYINDLYFLLKDKAIDWTYLMQKLRYYGIETVFFVGLFWCRQMWSLSLPANVQEMVNKSRVSSLADAYEKNWETNESVLETSPGLKQIVFFANSQTELAKKLRIYRTYVSSFVFRASTLSIGKRLIYIPKELGFITVFTRAIRSVMAS
ncbi:nucleotidyltransferase family protein [Spirosoma sp.]|uniref:nucleotidyltransferase domain-containing protein n=1 Tax=Spirosoma sp. TaxID=1899569 RepID=UPI003B3AC0AA